MDAQESALFAKLTDKKAAVHKEAATKKAKRSAKTPRCLLRTLCALFLLLLVSLRCSARWALTARGIFEPQQEQQR